MPTAYDTYSAMDIALLTFFFFMGTHFVSQLFLLLLLLFFVFCFFSGFGPESQVSYGYPMETSPTVLTIHCYIRKRLGFYYLWF